MAGMGLQLQGGRGEGARCALGEGGERGWGDGGRGVGGSDGRGAVRCGGPSVGAHGGDGAGGKLQGFATRAPPGAVLDCSRCIRATESISALASRACVSLG